MYKVRVRWDQLIQKKKARWNRCCASLIILLQILISFYSHVETVILIIKVEGIKQGLNQTRHRKKWESCEHPRITSWSLKWNWH